MDNIHWFFLYFLKSEGAILIIYFDFIKAQAQNYYLVVFLTRPRTCAEQGDVFEADIEA